MRKATTKRERKYGKKESDEVEKLKPKKKPQDKKKDNAPEKNIASFNGDPIRPMRRIVETSWQSGRDV